MEIFVRKTKILALHVSKFEVQTESKFRDHSTETLPSSVNDSGNFLILNLYFLASKTIGLSPNTETRVPKNNPEHQNSSHIYSSGVNFINCFASYADLLLLVLNLHANKKLLKSWA